MKRPRAAADRFTGVPLCVPVGAAVAIGTVVSFFPEAGLLFAFTGLLGLIGWIVGAGWMVVRSALRAQWRLVASLGAGLVLCWPLMRCAGPAGDVIHFAIRYPVYAATIARDPERTTKPIAFHWGAFDDHIRILAYDATGAGGTEIIETYRRENTSAANGTVSHLIGNFYLVEIVDD